MATEPATSVPPHTPATTPSGRPLVECLEASGIELPEDLESSPTQDEVRTAFEDAPAASRDAALACLTTAEVDARLTPGLSWFGEVSNRHPDDAVFEGDFADPSATVIDDTVYAYATNTSFANVPVGSASIDHAGRLEGDALPDLPAWTEPGRVWAPSPLTVAPDEHLLYYTTLHTESGRQCISVAKGATPGGPFVDRSDEPLVCQLDEGGSIDPSAIVVGGEVHLLWKSDGNCCGRPTKIWSAPLADGGTRVAGEPVELMRNDQPWEGSVVEAPSMVAVDGRYLLLYSGNDWASASYAVGYAWCETVRGPCTKPSSVPLLDSTDAISGPGGAHTYTGADGDLRILYHAWIGDTVGYGSGGARALFVEPLDVVDGEPTLPRRDE